MLNFNIEMKTIMKLTEKYGGVGGSGSGHKGVELGTRLGGFV